MTSDIDNLIARFETAPSLFDPDQFSKEHPITICTLGPCTQAVAAEPWLTASPNPDPNQITIVRSRP